MASDSQVGCLGSFFKFGWRRIKPLRPESSSQLCPTKIEPSGELKSRSGVASEVDDLDVDQLKEGVQYFSPHCDYSCSPSSEWWTLSESRPPSYSAKEPTPTDADSVTATIERTLDNLNPKLRDLSLKIHGILILV